eukprot:1103256_1
MIVSLRYKEQKPVKFRLSKQDAHKNLTIIQSKIESKFNLNSDQYTLEINNASIEPKLDNAQQLTQILSSTRPPITIVVNKVTTNIVQNDTYFTLKVHYQDKRIKCPFSVNIDTWTNDMFTDLTNRIKRTFQIKSSIEVYEDEDYELEIDDIESLKLVFESIDIKLNPNFVFDLYVTAPPQNPTDMDEEETKQSIHPNPTDDPYVATKPPMPQMRFSLSAQRGTTMDIRTIIPGDKTQEHRLYFLGPSGSHSICIHFSDISTQFYAMTPVYEDKLKNLTYLNANIPWNTGNANVLQVVFKWQRPKYPSGYTVAKQELKMDQKGYYYIEKAKDVSAQTKKKFGGGTGDREMIKKASKYILRHLTNNTTDYKSWQYAMDILQDIVEPLKAFDKDIIVPMFRIQTDALPQHQMVTVFRLLLIKMVNTKRSLLALDLPQIYHITQCCVMDKTMNSLLRLSNQKRRHFAWWMLQILHDDIKRLLPQDDGGMFASKKPAPHFLVFMYPIFNLFKYLEQDFSNHPQPFLKFKSDYKDAYYLNDKKCITIDVLPILKIDLKIGTLKNYKRRRPFESLAVRICWLMYTKHQKQDKMDMFVQIFEAIAADTTHATVHFIDLFNNEPATKAIFGLLSNRFDYWRQVIQHMTVQFISTNKHIVNLFRKNLIGEIGHMQNGKVKLRQLCALIVDLFALFDTVNIRIALLQNKRFIKSNLDNDQLTVCTNMESILAVVTRSSNTYTNFCGKRLPIVSSKRLQLEIQSFLVQCLSNEHTWKRDSVFRIFRIHKYKSNKPVALCFKNALNHVLWQETTVADRLIIFLECGEFYSLDPDAVHKDFIQEVLKGTHKEIQKWDKEQSNVIKQIVRTFAQEEQMNGRTLWNKIFNLVIVLPTHNAKTFNLDDAKFINKLKYCLRSLQWVTFAKQMEYIQSLRTFHVFCKTQLVELNRKMTTKTLQIDCIQLIHKQKEALVNLVMDCRYNNAFKQPMLNGMIDQYLQWDRIKTCLNTFREEYAAPQDAVWTETVDMVTFLDHWEDAEFETVGERKEWEEYNAHHKTLQFIGDTPSLIFRKMWFYAKEGIDAAWSFDDYFNILYPQVKGEWDDVIQKAKNQKLKINDAQWFELDAIEKELIVLGFSPNKATRLQRNISDALKLLAIKTFVIHLQEIVKLFKENKTVIKLEDNDQSWTTFQRCVGQTDGVTDETTVKKAGELYRRLRKILEIKANTNYNLQREWVKTTLSCRTSLTQILNDNEFRKQYFLETLQLLDESNDGELMELSSSLRSVQKQWSNIVQHAFHTETELVRYFATLNVTESDINNINQVHRQLPHIKQIVSDCGKMAQVRDKEKLDAAMNDANSYFKFKSQEEMRDIIEKYNYNKSIDEIARYGFVLQYTTNASYSVDQIENMMDVILLCKTNDIETYVRKLGICKEISELQVQYMIKGGRIKHQKMKQYQKIKASLKIKDENEGKEHSLEGIRDEWNLTMAGWSAFVKRKRINHHIFNYFTINALRTIIDKLNQYTRNESDCQELLCHFRFIKPEITEEELKQHIAQWQYIDSARDKAFDCFNQCFDCIVSQYTIQYNDISHYIQYGMPNLMLKKDKKGALFASLKLFIKNNENEKSINIPPYQYMICNEMTLTEDVEIFINRCTQNHYRHHSLHGYPLYCLMFPEDLNFSVLDQITDLFTDRLMTSDQQTKQYALIVISCNETNPISNLLQQHQVKNSINPSRRLRTSEPTPSNHTSHLRAASMCSKPRLLSDTTLTRSTPFGSTQLDFNPNADRIDRFTNNDGAKICNVLFNNSDNMFKGNKLFVKLYQSETFGAGKSFVIQKQSMETNGKEANIIRIPFNGPNIDLDFVVKRLFKCYDGRKRNKIIYHLDISSSATDTVNCVLFNILFLKYIATPKNQCFSITTDMAFLIEIPAALSSLTKSKRNVESEFYLLHRPMKFKAELVNRETNPFQYDSLNDLNVNSNLNSNIKDQSKKASVDYIRRADWWAEDKTHKNLSNCRYAAKYLQCFYANKLRTDDPNPDKMKKISNKEIKQLLQEHLPSVLRLSHIHARSFWDYLHCQFRQVVSSHLLRNELYGNQSRRSISKWLAKGSFSQWLHVTTESIIELAQDFATTNYDMKKEKELMEQNFHLTEKWQKANKEIVLLNQMADGSISFLVSDKNTMDKSRKEALEKFKFDLLGWKQLKNDTKSKREKLQLLLKIIGNPIKEGIVHKGKEVEYYSQKNKQWMKGKIKARTKKNIHIILDDKSDVKIIAQTQGKDRIRAYCAVFSESPYCDYALTYDNMLKMIAIFFRVKSGIPVILMGETGCGKTFLLDYLAKAANIEIETVNVHGGFTAKDIREKMKTWIQKAKKKLGHRQHKLQQIIEKSESKTNESVLDKDIFISRKDIVADMKARHELQTDDDLWIFLDEINTSSDIGYFKEILCDKSFDGEPLPPNMKIIGACNPNTERKMDDITNKSVLDDPLARLVYRVYPLPQTMLSYVWIFGSLQHYEKQYVIQMTQSMIEKLNKKLKPKEQNKLQRSIVYSQETMRRLLKDSGMFVSLRDVARCLQIFKWEFNRMGGFNYSLWKALAITYYYRLDDRQRGIYAKVLTAYTDMSLEAVAKQFYADFEALFKIELPGIAWNQTLKENLFVLLTCIQTKIPCILVGKPGSSKTLALSIIRDFLSSTTKRNEDILKHHNLKPIYVLPFQCSAHSKAKDILKKWRQTVAKAQHTSNRDTIYVLLLDEIGLAEHSPNRPLKVLHQLLEIEPAPIAFVGLSNWQLDAAKMNRVVMHQCYIHKKTDLKNTARAMAQQFYSRGEIQRMETRLDALCGIYCDLMNPKNKLQPRNDFFGARDYYGVIRHFLSRNAPESTNEDIVMHFLRNFGGIDYNARNQNLAIKDDNQQSFIDIMKHNLKMDSAKTVQDFLMDFNPSTLILMNLGDTRVGDVGKQNVFCSDNFSLSRHVMVITEFTNSWNVLLDLHCLSYDNVFIFGSDFERDKSNIYLYLNHVKNCMETGQTLILIHLDEIHESLYDMLNQRYVFRKTDNKMYCRIALGSNSQTCFVDANFKCIVITSKASAHSDNGTPIAFLNRFEKQLVSYYNSLNFDQFRLLFKLRIELFSLYQCHDETHFGDIFPGYCRDTLPSIVINVWNYFDKYREHGVMDINLRQDSHILINECIKILCHLNSTESLVRAASSKRFRDISFDTVCTLKGIIQMDDIYIYDELTAHNPTDDPPYDDSDDDMDEKDMVDGGRELKTFRDIVAMDYHFKSYCEWCKDEEFDSDAIHADMNVAATLSNTYRCFRSNYPHIKRKLFKYDEHDKSRLIVVLTYDFEFNLDRNAPYLHKTKIKRMDEFGKVHYFEDFIEHFLTYDTSFHHLLLHYKHKKDRSNHFIHIKHIILSLIDKYKKSVHMNKQIILMVHLQRKHDLYTEFPLIHSNSYKIMYLDSLSQQSPIHLSVFVKQKVSDICQQRGLPLLQHAFPRALSRLQFEREMRPVDIEGEIRKFTKILSKNCDDSYRPIRQSMRQRFVTLLRNPAIDANISQTVCTVIQESAKWTKGAFDERLNDTLNTLSVCAMSHVLQLLYTNHNIHSIWRRKNEDDNRQIRNVFIALYCWQNKLMEDKAINSNIAQILHGAKRSHHIGCKYRAKFPFSNLVSEWFNWKKSMIVAEERKSEDEYESDEDELEALYAPKKNEYEVDNAKELFVRYCVVLNNELNALPLSLETLSSDRILELYAQDMMHIYAESLLIDDATPLMALTLGAKFLIAVTCLSKGDSDCITIADLECVMWTQNQLLTHFVHILCILDNDKLNAIDIDSRNKETLIETIKVLLRFVYESLNETPAAKSQLYYKLKVNEGIFYLIRFFKNDKSLIESLNCIKLQWIACKHQIEFDGDDHDLADLMEGQRLLLDYKTLRECLTLFVSLIPQRIKRDKKTQNVLCNRVLHDLLNLVDNDYIAQECSRDAKNNFYEFLVDLLCSPHKIIVDSKLMRIMPKMRYQILIQLFDLLRDEKNVQMDQMVAQMQTKNDQFAAVLIEIMGKSNKKYKIDFDRIEFVDSRTFHRTYSIQTPLIASIHGELYDKCMSKVSVASFFAFVDKSMQQKYPVLYGLSAMNATDAFWCIPRLPNVVQWMSLVHSRYTATLSRESCAEVSIDDVLAAAQYNKWGDMKEWTSKWKLFEREWNASFPAKVEKSTIYSSLIGTNDRCGVPRLFANYKCVQTLIHSHNNYLMKTAGCKSLNLFDIKSSDLVDCRHSLLLQIIGANARGWICYNTHCEKECATYIVFDMQRIEEEVFNVCIAGRKRIRVTFDNFKFVGSNQMFKYIAQLKEQTTLSYHVWHAFDAQFETNVQRKRALAVLEDVIPLLINNKFCGDDVLWKLMLTNLRFYTVSNEYLYFKFDAICVKNVQSLWSKMIGRIEDKMKEYASQCMICREAISAETPIQLECCGLNLHYNCLEEYIENTFLRNNGRKVTLKQLSCLICRQRMRNKQIATLFEPINALYDKVREIALARLRYDRRDTDDAIVIDGEHPADYAIKLYAVFVCFSCKNPYFGGMNNCQMDFAEDDDDDNDFAEERLCNRCLPQTMNQKECGVHGDQYIQWKCRYCCSGATFFCWGTHHFCQICHWKAYTLKNKPIHQLVQCPCKPNINTKLPQPCSDGEECPLAAAANLIGIKHPPSGEEYCLGCALCQRRV